MHTYSINSKRKNFVLIFLIIITSIVYNFFQRIGFVESLVSFENNIAVISILIDWGFISVVVTPILIFRLIYYLFNNYIWRFKLVAKLLEVPNINGCYKGELISMYKDPHSGKVVDPIKMELKVTQTYEEILFISIFPNSPSESRSEMGALMSFDRDIAEFIFAYDNKSEETNIENHHHEGMNRLKFNIVHGEVSGNYFNNRGKNPNKGTMKLNKVKENFKS